MCKRERRKSSAGLGGHAGVDRASAAQARTVRLAGPPLNTFSIFSPFPSCSLSFFYSLFLRHFFRFLLRPRIPSGFAITYTTQSLLLLVFSNLSSFQLFSRSLVLPCRSIVESIFEPPSIHRFFSFRHFKLHSVLI